MKYIDEIVSQNKKTTSKKKANKPAKKKIITVAVQKVETTYLKVYANSQEQAEKIALGWHRDGKFDEKVVKIDGEPAHYLNGPITYGVRADILGLPINNNILSIAE